MSGTLSRACAVGAALVSWTVFATPTADAGSLDPYDSHLIVATTSDDQPQQTVNSPLPPASYVGTADGAPLVERVGPGTEYEMTGRTYADGEAIHLVCTTYGSTVDGSFEGSRLWNKLDTGYFVSNAYVTGPGAPPCDDASPEAMTPQGVDYVDTDAAPLTVRNGPGTYTPRTGLTIPDLTPVAPQCLLYGTSVTGTQGESAVWLRLGDLGYIPAAYVHKGTHDSTLRVCGDLSEPEDDTEERPTCTLDSGSEKEVYDLLFGGECLAPDEVFAPDPGDPAYPDALKPLPGDIPYLSDPLASRRPFVIQDIGPEGESSYGIRWDGCSVPDQAKMIPGMDDVSHPFGFDFLPACQVHDLGYRLIDRHILPESAEEPMDTFFAQMLGRICVTQYSDRLAACREVALTYASAVMTADHEPKPDGYPRVYGDPPAPLPPTPSPTPGPSPQPPP